jgi:outer membrane biosynthesis protein TonB
VKLKGDIVASVALHVLVIGWGLVTFSARSLEVVPEALPVDIISSADLSKMTAGMKNGDKDKPKPLVEKVADAKPVDEALGKIDDKKKEVVTSTSTAEPPPKPVEKKVDVKPKEEPKQAEKKPDPKEDPIAEALKTDEAKKPKPKPEAKAAPPQPQKPKERVFDQSKIANLLDKRDPTRQSITGAALNPTSSLGTATGNSDTRVATWKGAFVRAVRTCFNFPYNGQDADQFEVDIDINMRPDGTLASTPVVIAVRGPSKSVADAMGESARRAVQQCQAYSFLPKEQYETWKYIPMTFGLRDMM